VVAPIKRAVDDGTAKELMGEQFKRRLLMDGQYGNIAFICTQTDDCEATEIMRDHEDVAVRVPGRWQEMSSLRDKINDIEIKCSDLQQQEEDLKFADDEAKELLKEISSDLQNATTPREDKTDSEIDDDDEAFVLDDDAEEIDMSTVKNVDENTIQELLQQVSNQTKTVGKTTQALLLWRDAHTHKIHRLTSNCSKLQRRLKGICAKVRNEYSTKCLQEDFITGLKEIYRDEQELSEGGENNVAIRDDISLPVFCISANDYLKLTG
jgi:chromosome segregation ATPase